MKHLILFIAILLVNSALASTPIDVFESTLKISGLNEEVLYYGFAAGDQLIFNFEEVNDKELKEIEISELPSSSKFMDYKTTKVENKVLTITTQGIYKFRFSNSSLGGRVCKIKIQRIPASERTANFNTNVYWREVFDTTYTITREKYLVKKEYKPIRLVKEKHYINSGSNATFKGGKSRIVVPVQLPNNTVKWYYTFSAYRNENDLERVHQTINLLGDISNLIDRTGAVNFGLQMLTEPPGGNVCDIYLFNLENANLFEQKLACSSSLEYSRKNLTSGIVQVNSQGLSNIYLGIMNPDDFYGVHATLEVVAITLNEQWGIKDVKTPSVTSRKEAYLMN